MSTSIPASSGDDLKLQHGWTFWYIQKSSVNGTVSDKWTKEVQPLGSFDTVRGFWRLYSHILRPNDVKESVDLFLFKHGIKPMWEDPANAKGGRWVVRLKKGLASHYWESLILAIIGEQFDVGNEICGAAVNISPQRDSIAVWNRHADNVDAVAKIKETLQRVLDLPHWVPLKYKRFYEPPEGSKDNNGSSEYDQQQQGNRQTAVRSFEGLLRGDEPNRPQNDRSIGPSATFNRGFRRQQIPQEQNRPPVSTLPGDRRGAYNASGLNKGGRGFGRNRYDASQDPNAKIGRSVAAPAWRQKNDGNDDPPRPSSNRSGGFETIGAWRRGAAEPGQQRMRYSSTGTDESQ